MELERCSTGLDSLDKVLDYLRLGDNVVWQVDSIEDYIKFSRLFIKSAIENKRRVVYMRFADHEPIIVENPEVQVYWLDAQDGFESFSTKVHNIITLEGLEVFYVFDCLSDLLSQWATDLMIGNFFFITCPYLYELRTIAYFSILRDRHSYDLVSRIRETTQLLLDLYCHKEKHKVYYIHPLKVSERYSPTMFLPHVISDESCIPITSSIESASLFSDLQHKRLGNKNRKLDYWDRVFGRAEELYNRIVFNDKPSANEINETVELLSKMVISKEKRILELTRRFFSLEDLLNIKSRLIGTGFIGGKSVGMLLARNILLKDKNFNWQIYLEPHDSFFIGSDVFYSYIVQNGWWKNRVKQKTQEGYFEVAKELRVNMLEGKFPLAIREQFVQMLEYFGQSPIIVRSSSLLEDGFGNAFAGKYESVFCVNQGSPEERYKSFEEAVRIVYSSILNEDALTYRFKRGLQYKDEQMALLVQRVSGSYNKKYFFPQIAGVGFSYNTYSWNKEINPESGMLRLVYGLGTRAVDRVETDYPRLVSLDKPLLKTHAHLEDMRRFTQQNVDVLNIEENCMQTISLKRLIGENPSMKMDIYGIRDHEINRRIRELGIENEEAWILTFDRLLTDTKFNELMKRILKTLEKVYEYPVDIEFATNFLNNMPQINILQCRPLQTKGEGKKVEIPKNILEKNILIKSKGNFMGGSIDYSINKIIIVDPEKYSNLESSKRYDVARLVGKLNNTFITKDDRTMLLGPGRWGTSTPSLGVPVRFSEISNINILGEIEFTSKGLIPELSFGTHFFQDLVETDIFYIAIFPKEQGVVFNQSSWGENQLRNIIPSSTNYEDVVGVYMHDKINIKFKSDLVSQNVLCYIPEN